MHTYIILPFVLCNAPSTFQRIFLGTIPGLIHDYVEVYMDDFTICGNTFEEKLENLEIFLIRCQETNVSLSHEKCHILLNEVIVLGHCISSAEIKVDLAKIEVISKLPIQRPKRMSRDSWDM